MIAILLFVFSLILRLITANQSFWLDEGATISLARLPLANLFGSIVNDFHPPLSYLIFHFWLPIAGKSEWLIRLPNIIFGALAVSVFYLFLKEVFVKEKNKLALAAAFLLAINPLHIYYSIELRMYSLSLLLTILTWYFLRRALKNKQNSPTTWRYFVVFSILNLFTFYGAFFNLVSQWVYVFWQNKKKLKPFLICNLLIGGFFIFWIPTLIKQLAGGGYLTRTLPGWSQLSGNLSLKSLALIMAKFSFGRISLANKSAYAIFVGGISIYFLFCSLLAFRKKENRFFLIWFFVPLLLASLISLVAPMMGYWRFIFLIPAFVAIIVLGLNAISGNSFYFNILIISTIFIFGNLVFWTSPQFQREDWRASAKLISVDRSLSIINFPDVFAPLKFYAPEVYFYPSQESLGRLRTDLDQTLPLVLKDKQRVFVFDYLSDLTDKDRLLIRWLKQAGLVERKIHNVYGVGFIYEFIVPGR